MTSTNPLFQVRRLGGAYGGKIEKCNLSAAACAVAANKLNVPVRIVLDIKTNMEMLGKRLPYYAKYKVMVTPEGVLKSVGIKMYCDCGDNFNSPTVDMAKTFSQNCYHSEKWRVSPNAVLTNTPSNTYVRAPGTTQGHAIIETIMEHAAMELGMDPLEFRLKNILKKGDKLLAGGEFEDEMNPVKILIEQVQNSSKFQERKSMIQEFNEVIYIHLLILTFVQKLTVVRLNIDAGKSMEKTRNILDTRQISAQLLRYQVSCSHQHL